MYEASRIHVSSWPGCAGLAARMSTQMRREREEQQRLVQEELEFERIMSVNLGPMKSLDDEQEVVDLAVAVASCTLHKILCLWRVCHQLPLVHADGSALLS